MLRCLGYQFNVDYRVTMLIVLWALGWSMIVLSALVHLPLSGDHGVRSRPDRGAQPVRRHPAGDRAGHDSARPGIRDQRPARGVRGVSADSVGRRDRGGLRARADLRLGPAERRRAFLLRAGLLLSAAFVVLRGVNVYGDPSRWTASGIVDHHRAVVPEHDQVAAVAAVPADDARPGAADAARGRSAGRRAGSSRRWCWGKVPLFYYVLHFALLHLLAVGVCVCALPRRALDVRVARRRELSVHAAARLGLFAAGRLRDLDRRGVCAVSGVPMVRGREAAAARPVAQLSVKGRRDETAMGARAGSCTPPIRRSRC